MLSAAPQLINRDDKKSEQKGATIEAKAQLRYVLPLQIILKEVLADLYLSEVLVAMVGEPLVMRT